MQISRRPDALEKNMIVGLSGDLDLGAVARARSAFHEVISDGWSTVIVDLSGVSFVDSAGLGILVGLQRRCREIGGAAVLVNLQAPVSRIIEVSNLDAVLPVAEDMELAGEMTLSRAAGVIAK